MINEVLNEIIQAEQKAQEIKQTADDTAFQISADAQKKYDEILADAILASKNAREQILTDCSNRADENYKNILSQSQSDAKKLVSEKQSDAKKLGEQIFGRIINGNC